MLHTRLAPFLALLLVAAAHAHADGPIRDDWFAVVEGDLRYGSYRLTVEHRDGGGFVYTTRTRALLDLFGAQRQEMRTVATFHVTSDYRPISFESESVMASGATRVAGELVGNTLTFVTTADGVEARSTFELDPSQRVISDAAIDDWLRGQPADVLEASATIFDSSTWTLAEGVATRTADAPNVWHLSSPGVVTTTTLTFDDEGAVAERLTFAPSTRTIPCTEAEANDLDYKVWTGREMLTFPVDAEIGLVDALEHLTVELTWRDIPLDEFDLEDARQRLVEHHVTNGEHRAVVTIDDAEPIDATVTLPIDDDALAPFLAETEYVKPTDDAVVAAAQSAIGDADTALGGVEAICDWVYGYIDGSMIAETLTGPQVLERKTGKCTEYTTLYASMARAVGIPTRIALGERLVGGQWMGHMWCESYVDGWVPVDASANEVGTSFALLKFVDSDTVLGTQTLRWKLTESLEIHVKDFTARESALDSMYETGIDGTTYTNVDYACRITAPDGWRLDDVSDPNAAMIRMHVPDAEGVMVHFVAFELPPGTPAKAITDSRMAAFRGQSSSFEVLRDDDVDVAGVVGRRTRFTGAGEDTPDATYTAGEVMWVIGPRGYLITLSTPADGFEPYADTIDTLLESFEVLGVDGE